MARSKWKTKFFLKFFELYLSNKTVLRQLVLSFYLINKLLKIHNGKIYVFKQITYPMLGYRLGDFVFTQKQVYHSKKEQTKKNK